ncbi:MAG: SWIM zinc finger family protein [Pelotomaculum sp.]
MKGILARVDEGRLGRAVAGLVQRSLVVEDVVRDGGEVRAKVRSSGVRGVQVYGVGITVVGRGHGVFCSCEDWRQRGIVCKHIAAVALHELGAQAHARSTRSMVGLLLQL